MKKLILIFTMILVTGVSLVFAESDFEKILFSHDWYSYRYDEDLPPIRYSFSKEGKNVYLARYVEGICEDSRVDVELSKNGFYCWMYFKDYLNLEKSKDGEFILCRYFDDEPLDVLYGIEKSYSPADEYKGEPTANFSAGSVVVLKAGSYEQLYSEQKFSEEDWRVGFLIKENVKLKILEVGRSLIWDYEKCNWVKIEVMEDYYDSVKEKNVKAGTVGWCLSDKFELVKNETATRSGFIKGFDKDKYSVVTDLAQAYRAAEEAYDKDYGYKEVYCASNFHFIQGNVFLDLSLPGYENWAGSNHYDVKLYADGSYTLENCSEGLSFPEIMPVFTNIKVYYHLTYGKVWIDSFIDGWEVVDDVRNLGQDYIATDNLKIRAEPSLEAKQIGLLKKDEQAEIQEVGEKVTIDGIESAWVRVRTADGTVGWCFAGYLTDGTEYREKPWTSGETAISLEKAHFEKILCAYDWYRTDEDRSSILRFYKEDGKLYLNVYLRDCYRDDLRIELQERGLAVEIEETGDGKLFCACDKIFYYLGKDVFYDGKTRHALYWSDDRPSMYAYDKYEF